MLNQTDRTRRSLNTAVGGVLVVSAVMFMGWIEAGGVASRTAVEDDAGWIVDRMLERGGRYRNDQFRAAYRARLIQVDRRLDENGDVQRERTSEYDWFPVECTHFERRVAIEGRPLSAAERVREAEREREFREELRCGPDAGGTSGRNENAINVNEELFSRYTVELDGEETRHGRPTYRLRFQPRGSGLPVRRGIDRALNRSSGRLWIDGETFEPVRLEFELNARVRLWWGVLGAIYEARGVVEREQVFDDVWAQTRQEVYTDMRIFFSRRRQASIREWSDFSRVAEPRRLGEGVSGAASRPGD